MRRIYPVLAGFALASSASLTVQARTQTVNTHKPQKTVITTETGDNFVFSPGKLTVKLGTKVTWSNPTNDAQIGHNVTSDTKAWKYLKDLPNGGKVSYTFKKAGTYKYECTLHPGMIAVIVVKK